MKKSEKLFEKALKIIPGGVNSPVRSFRSVGINPFYVKKAEGNFLHTEDGRKLMDFCCSWGALILGHAHREVVEAASSAAAKGMSYGLCHKAEILLAQKIVAAIPSVEKIRFMSSGTEAVMTALRISRAATGRPKIVKFAGCYHGHSDSLLVKAGSGLLTCGIPSSEGVCSEVASNTLLARYNDAASVEKLFSEFPGRIAAVIVEPVAGNMGLVKPKDGFLNSLRTLCSKNHAILIFDEVITGFRLTFGGYQNICGIRPDLTCLGKIIGGGMPVGAVGGKAALMDLLAPVGKVYQAGTLSGNPVAIAAGNATLEILKVVAPYARLGKETLAIKKGIDAAAAQHGVPACCSTIGSMFTVFFNKDEPQSLEDAQLADVGKFNIFFKALLEDGFFLPPSQFETAFVSTAHKNSDIGKFTSAARKAMGGCFRQQ